MIRPTLAQVFVATIAGLVILLSLLFWLLIDGTRDALVASAEQLRESASRTAAGEVQAFLSRAEKPIGDIEAKLDQGVLRLGDTADLEREFFGQLLAQPDIAEVTLTTATIRETRPDGVASFAEDGRGQISVYRVRSANGPVIVTRLTQREDRGFSTSVRERPADGVFVDKPWRKDGTVPDPTEHPTVQTPARRRFWNRLLWSDVHWTQFDDDRPEAQRRVVVTVQKGLLNPAGAFIGVLRVGIATDRLDTVAIDALAELDDGGAHRFFLCDRERRLISRLSPSDRYVESGNDLRIEPSTTPSTVAEALRQPELDAVDAEHPTRTARFMADGDWHQATFRWLPGTQDWIVGIVAPEKVYLAGLDDARRKLLLAALGVMVVILLGGVMTLRVVRRDLNGVFAETAKVRRFDFGPCDRRAVLRDVQDVMDGMERAKTAMRAMGKYVPVELVRELYKSNAEPTLGSAARELTVMFTDIKDFTTIAESLPAHELAPALGEYLKAMTDAVHLNSGTIDKYIGDAVMALWNAPSPVEDHARRACLSALACVRATDILGAAMAASGGPFFRTRFGIHRDTVLVGNFGAPDRLNYTAMGDGVNLASRLEALNKEYGTTILVSQSVHEQTAGAFEFRFIDRVAVKGKRTALSVYELLGVPGDCSVALLKSARNYEAAYELYLKRDFIGALRLLSIEENDAPSRNLAARCRLLIEHPPLPEWDGVHHMHQK